VSIAKGLMWGYIERWGNKVISLLVFLLLARLLAPNDFGLVALAKLIIDFLDILVAQGLGLAIIQKKDITNTHLTSVFWLLTLSALLVATVIFIFASEIASIFSEAELLDILRVLSVLILISAFSRVQAAILTREHKFRQLAYRGLLMSLVGGVTGVVMAINGFGVWSLVGQHIVSTFVALVVLWSATSWRPSLLFDFNAIKELYSYAFKVLLDQKLIFISNRIDEALIAVLLGTTALGYYSIAKRLFMTLVDMLYSSIGKVLVSIFSRIQDRIDEIADKLIGVIAVLSAICIPIFMFSSFMSDDIIDLLFGNKWATAASPFSIIVLSGIFFLTKTIAYPVFSAIGKPELSLKLNVVRSVISVGLILIGAIYGLTGIAMSILLSSFITSMIDIKALSNELRIRAITVFMIQFRYILYSLFAIFLIYISREYFLTGLSEQYYLIVSMLLFGTVYATTLYLFKSPSVMLLLDYYKRSK